MQKVIEMRIHTVLNPLCVTTYMLTLERVQTHPLTKRLNYEKNKGDVPSVPARLGPGFTAQPLPLPLPKP